MEMVNNLTNIKYIVYLTTNIINNKIYIGVHKVANKKFDYYIGCGVYSNIASTYNHPKTKFQYAVKKYGPKNFIRKTIAEFDNEDDAYYLEELIVNTEFLSRSDVYNMIPGGKTTEKTTYLNPSIKIYRYDSDGKFEAEYESILQAAKSINRSRRTLTTAAIEGYNCANYYWSFNKVEQLNIISNKKIVHCYDSAGKFLKTYKSISEASKSLNVETSLISRAIKLGYKISNFYFSEIKSEEFAISKKRTIYSKTVYQYSLTGEFQQEFENANIAKKKLGLTSDIGAAIRIGRTCGGYQWSYEKLPKMADVSKNTCGKARKVAKYDLEGNLIKIYNTVTECAKEHSGCKKVLSGQYKKSGGYIFKYSD